MLLSCGYSKNGMMISLKQRQIQINHNQKRVEKIVQDTLLHQTYKEDLMCFFAVFLSKEQKKSNLGVCEPVRELVRRSLSRADCCDVTCCFFFNNAAVIWM